MKNNWVPKLEKWRGWGAIILMSVFPLSLHAQTFQLLHTFNDYWDGDGDSANPLIQGSDGNFYGSTLFGGTNNAGTLFKMTPDGEFTVLDVLNNVNGSIDSAPLFEGTDGNFYGTTSWDDGSIFRMAPNGALTTLASFSYTNGSLPNSPLVRTSDGTIYGTTRYGGAVIDEYGDTGGTIFKLTPDGTIITLLSFGMTNGSLPWEGMIQARDGNLYGTTREGGDLSQRYYGYGTVFKATTNGELTTLAIFSITNGVFPGRLPQANDGNLYGTTSGGGAYGNGTIFEITTNGIFTNLFDFPGTNGYALSLIKAGDGNFYGATSDGGAQNGGTVFRMTPDGKVTTIFASFDFYSNGVKPSGLMQANDGNLYGVTSDGGSHFNGTIFRIILSPTLNFTRSANNLVISWPTNAVGFTLQSISDLNSSNWIDSSDAPAVVNGGYVVTNTLFGSERFYRLRN